MTNLLDKPITYCTRCLRPCATKYVVVAFTGWTARPGSSDYQYMSNCCGRPVTIVTTRD